VLVIGKNVSDAAAHAAKVKNVSKVLVVDHDAFANSLAEDVSKVVQEIAPKYSHILAPSSNSTKNFIPRAAALLDASPLTDVVSVVDDSTFKRPVYAGNAIATVKMSNAHKVFLQLL
jgi:electron transfer flavoprotein alpha subunit